MTLWFISGGLAAIGYLGYGIPRLNHGPLLFAHLQGLALGTVLVFMLGLIGVALVAWLFARRGGR